MIGAEDMDEQEKTEKAEKKNLIDRFLSNDKVLRIIVMLGFAGIALIFLSSRLTSQTDSSLQTDISPIVQTDTSEEYKNRITEELGNMLASMEGTGRTKVMVTLSGTERDIYAADTDTNDKQSSKKTGENENADQQNTEKKKYTIIREKDGSEKALSVGQLVPEIKGVLVICDGGDNEEVRDNIINAVSAALNIQKSHIYVSKLGK